MLTFTFWLGTVSVVVADTSSNLKDHEKKPSHATVAVDVATIKQKIETNSRSVEEIKVELKEQSRRMEENQKEILRAIRDNGT